MKTHLEVLYEILKAEECQDGGEREEAESEPPIVKSWRDAGDTLCRHNH
jgi:hypothetical protein